MKKKAPDKAIAARKKPRRSPELSGDFESLVASIAQIHRQAQEFATKAVNVGLTLRNWFIGMQIEIYERQGADRAAYGDKLMDVLAGRLKKQGWERCDRRELYRFRQLFLTYPNIVETLSPQSHLGPELQSLLAHLPPVPGPIWESVTAKSPIMETASPQLIHLLSFSHLAELLELPDATQRRFYEIECIRGNWSVRELRRQKTSCLYERLALTRDKAGIRNLAKEGQVITKLRRSDMFIAMQPYTKHSSVGATCL